jgi:hypothetical protein
MSLDAYKSQIDRPHPLIEGSYNKKLFRVTTLLLV